MKEVEEPDLGYERKDCVNEEMVGKDGEENWRLLFIIVSVDYN